MANVKLSKEDIDAIFEKAENQGDYIIALYSAVIPDWDKVDHVDGYPSSSREMNTYLVEKAMEHDKKHSPECMAGGAWGLNYGFSEDNSVPMWEVSTDSCRVIYK